MILLFLYLAGMCEGIMDTLSFHYNRFKIKHPKANMLFWNPEVSWANKYDENFRPKFFLSTTALVFLTDGWHLFKFLRNIFIFTGIYFCLDLWYIAPLAYLANRLGFTIVYNWFYK